VSLPSGRPSGRTEAHVCFLKLRQERLEERGKCARNAPGLVRAATPADEMDRTVNVSVMEGLNADVRGNNRNRHCDCEHNNGARFGAHAGAAGRSFGEASCI